MWLTDLAVFRHAAGPLAGKTALRWRGSLGGAREITYAELAASVRRCANALRDLGIARGDVMLVHCTRLPELFMTVLGALAIDAIIDAPDSPSPPPKLLVTTSSLYTRELAGIRAQLATLERVIVIDDGAGIPAGTLDWHALIARASPTFDPGATHVPTPGESPLSLAAALSTLGLSAEDIVWSPARSASPLGLLLPLVAGATVLLDEPGTALEHVRHLIRHERVTVCYDDIALAIALAHHQ